MFKSKPVNKLQKFVLWYLLPVAAIFRILWNFSHRIIVFNDYALFTSFQEQFDAFYYLWADKSGGFARIPLLSDAMYGVFSLLAFNNLLISQNLFLLFFGTLGYFGFRRVLGEVGVTNLAVLWLLPLLFVFNPNTFIYSTGIWIFYNTIPWFFFFFIRLLRSHDYRYGFGLAVVLAVALSNYQIAFWNLGWIYIFSFLFIVLGFFQTRFKLFNFLPGNLFDFDWQKYLKNFVRIVGYSFLGLSFNLISVRALLGYTSNLGNLDYIESFHGCYPAVFWNLSRIGANGCNLMASMDYIQDSWWNVTGYIIPLVILFSLFGIANIWKKLDRSKLIILFISAGFVAMTLLLALLLRYKLIDFLIIAKNPIIVSLRNPVKILEPFVFFYLIIFGFSLNFVLHSLQKNWQKLALGVTTFTLLVIYVHPFFMPNWNYERMQQDTYWVNFDNPGSYYLTEKYSDLDKNVINYDQGDTEVLLDLIRSEENILYLPLDYSTGHKTRWYDQIFRDKADVMRQSVDNTLALDIYTAACDGDWDAILDQELNLNYVVLDKNAESMFNHDYAPVVYGGQDCQVELDQNYYVWGEYDYFDRSLSEYTGSGEIIDPADYPYSNRLINTDEKIVYYEDENWKVYRISDIVYDEFEGVIKVVKDSPIRYELQGYGGGSLVVRKLFHESWVLKSESGVEVQPTLYDDKFMKFDLSEFEDGEELVMEFSLQHLHSRLLLISLISFTTSALYYILILIQNYRTKK